GRGKVDRDQLHLGHLLHRVAQSLPAETALLHAAERERVPAKVGRVVEVDPARADPLREGEPAGEVAGVDGGLQTVGGRVRDANRVVEVVEPYHRSNRSERLLARDPGVLGYLVHHRGPVEVSRTARGAGASGEDLRRPGPRVRHELFHPYDRRAVDEGTDLRRLLERGTDPKRVRALGERPGELLRDRILHEDALRRGADLPRVTEGAPNRGGERDVQCGIV